MTIADDLASARWAVQAAEWDSRVYAAVALHPTRAGALDDAARAEIEQLAAHPRVVAIGETGMDLYWPGRLDGCADPATQREAFAWHIDLAKRTGKPLMIHNRDADSAVLDVLRGEGAPGAVIFTAFRRTRKWHGSAWPMGGTSVCPELSVSRMRTYCVKRPP